MCMICCICSNKTIKKKSINRFTQIHLPTIVNLLIVPNKSKTIHTNSMTKMTGGGKEDCFGILLEPSAQKPKSTSSAVRIIKKGEQMLIPNGVDRHFPVFHRNILSFCIKGGYQREGVSCCTHNTCISKTPAVGFPLLRDSIIKSALSKHITPAQELKPLHQQAPLVWKICKLSHEEIISPLKSWA